jgi:hypothetical protein
MPVTIASMNGEIAAWNSGDRREDGLARSPTPVS